MFSLFSDCSVCQCICTVTQRIREALDAFNITFSARRADPYHHFDRPFQSLLKACDQYLGSVQFESSAFRHYIAANALGRSSGCVPRHALRRRKN
jgi:hypothetical protein